MIHLVHFSPHPGGLEVLIPVFVNAFSNFEFSAFTIRESHEGKFNIYEDLQIPHITGSGNNMLACIKLFRYARIHRKELFHVFNIGPLFLLLLKLAGVKKLVYSIHGTIYWKTKKQRFVRKLLWKFALSKRFLITANSEYSKGCFNKQISEGESIVVLYNPIDSDKFKPLKLEKKKEHFKVIYIGRLTSGKNLYRWISIAAKIKNENKNAEFEIYGDGPLKNDLIEYVQKLGLKSCIKFMGHTAYVVSAYQNANLLLFLSEYESFGNVAVESILCGTPVIAAAIPSMKEIFDNYPEFLVENDEDLEKNIVKKISQIEELKKLVPSARKEFMERFSLEQHIQKLEQIYKSFHNQEP